MALLALSGPYGLISSTLFTDLRPLGHRGAAGSIRHVMTVMGVQQGLYASWPSYGRRKRSVRLMAVLWEKEEYYTHHGCPKGRGSTIRTMAVLRGKEEISAQSGPLWSMKREVYAQSGPLFPYEEGGLCAEWSSLP